MWKASGSKNKKKRAEEPGGVKKSRKKAKRSNDARSSEEDDNTHGVLKNHAAAAPPVPVRAVTVPDDDHTNSSSITSRGGGASSMVNFVSPYEEDYCAEDGEDLFEKGSLFFDAFEDYDKKPEDFQVQARASLRSLSKIGVTPEASFLAAAYEAREQVRNAQTLWEEEWCEESFGNYKAPFAVKHRVQEYLLLLFIQPKHFANAKYQALYNLYIRRKLRDYFKGAVEAMDPDKQFPLLWSSPGRAVRARGAKAQARNIKMMIFLVRTHLLMKLLYFKSFEEMAEGHIETTTLRQKCIACLEKLEESAATVQSPNKANTAVTTVAATTTRTTAAAAAAAPSIHHESDEDDHSNTLDGPPGMDGGVPATSQVASLKRDEDYDEGGKESQSDNNNDETDDDDELDHLVESIHEGMVQLRDHASHMCTEMQKLRRVLKNENVSSKRKRKDKKLLQRIKRALEELDDSDDSDDSASD